MSRIPILFLPLAALGCSPGGKVQDNTIDITAATQAPGSIDAYGTHAGSDNALEISETDATTNRADSDFNGLAPLDPPAAGTPGGLPDDRTPISEAPFTPDSAQGAANVVQTYYALIGEGKYARAFALRDVGVAKPGAAAAFAADFARYSEYHANVGAPGDIDAGAGQRFVTVPVQIYARLKQGGAPVYQIGSVVLHRTGDIDGASVEQRTWHIRSIDLKVASKR